MIIVRAPFRISFVGGGTDLPAFYHNSPGRVISTAIDKYVYVAVNRPPLARGVSARYSMNESVSHPSELQNHRIREALLNLGFKSNIEVTTFTDVTMNAGLGSSSSFSTALMKALHAAQGRKLSNREAAEEAARLEIGLVKEPIGKQDQYAAAFGGFNVFQFNADESVDVAPVHLDYQKKHEFEQHLFVFFTGIYRLASSVLTEQSAHTEQNIETLRKMADSVFEFKERLCAGDFQSLGRMLHEGWLRKKTLASNLSNEVIDEYYAAGIEHGAWGGKVLGAGGGGSMLFFAPPEAKPAIRAAVQAVAVKHNLSDFNEIPVTLVQSGVEVVMNNERISKTTFV